MWMNKTGKFLTQFWTDLYVCFSGDLLADSIDNSIQDDSLASLIRMPGGCVEQNLATITLPLIAAHYLDRSAKWDVVGVSRREEAIKYIQRGAMRDKQGWTAFFQIWLRSIIYILLFFSFIGYENQLNYRKTDDSYPPYAKEGTSTWYSC